MSQPAPTTNAPTYDVSRIIDDVLQLRQESDATNEWRDAVQGKLDNLAGAVTTDLAEPSRPAPPNFNRQNARIETYNGAINLRAASGEGTYCFLAGSASKSFSSLMLVGGKRGEEGPM